MKIMTIVVRAVRSAIGVEECGLIVALALLGAGFRSVWSPLGLIVPGAILVWILLPPRVPFITWAPTAADAKKGT